MEAPNGSVYETGKKKHGQKAHDPAPRLPTGVKLIAKPKNTRRKPPTPTAEPGRAGDAGNTVALLPEQQTSSV